MSAALSPSERLQLKERLLERLRQDINTSVAIGYSPTAFIGMISKHGPVDACIRVVTAPRLPDGFLKLLELGRLDLTAERTILDGAWRQLFSQAVTDAAKKTTAPVSAR